MNEIVLAVSGGCDSMYLAYRAPEFFPGASFIVAHCNFGLRGAESDADEQFVREWCREKGWKCEVRRFEAAAFAATRGISTEMAARELRYAWFAELCSEGGRALAVAHNANDNAETLMLNLLRGTGSRGLRGMSADCILDGTRVLRPMLGVSRSEIESWMRENGHEWREDSTNSESAYKRNKIRNIVFPVFREINPSFIRTLNEDIARFVQTDDIAADYCQEALKKVRTEDGRYRIKALLELKHWKFVLWRILEPSGISAPTFEKLVTLMDRYRNEPPGTVTLGGKTFETPGFNVIIRNKHLIVEKRN